MDEIIDKRTEKSKTFRMAGNEYRQEIHLGLIHYKKGSKFEKIDTKLEKVKKGWGFTKGLYQGQVPQYSDGDIVFYVKNKHIRMKALDIKRVEGQVIGKSNNGWHGKKVEYIGAYEGIGDLMVTCKNGLLLKEVRINKNPGKDLQFKFEVSGNFSFKKHLRRMKVWDSGSFNIELGEIELQRKKKVITVVKTIPKKFMDKAVFPIYTDISANYYTGNEASYPNKDYSHSYYGEGSWATIRDSETGALAHADIRPWTGPYNGTKGYDVCRAYIPVDTSGLPNNGIKITSATFKAYAYGKKDYDNDGEDFIVICECNSPYYGYKPVPLDDATEYSNRVDLGDISTSAYNTWTLTSGGRDNISQTGWSYFVMREGHDFLDSAFDNSKADRNELQARGSEQAGTSYDPYYTVNYIFLARRSQFI